MNRVYVAGNLYDWIYCRLVAEILLADRVMSLDAAREIARDRFRGVSIKDDGRVCEHEQ
jgi:hypothetical protein